MSGLVVIVDDREPQVAAERLREFGLAAVGGRLDAGDYACYPHGLSVGIERKTMSNLLQSLANKQMVGQAHKMVANYDIAFLLREGAFRRSPAGAIEYYSPRDPRAVDDWVLSGWSWDSFQGIMIDLQMMGIRLIDCPVLGEYPMEIARLVTNLSKDQHRWIKDRQRPDVVALDKQWRNAVWALSAFDGIGPDTVKPLHERYGSHYCVVRAAVEWPDEFAETVIVRTEKRTARLGKKLAYRLREELLETWQKT